MLHDLRVAARRLTSAPSFSLIALLTLGLGLGATTAMFSVVNAILLRPMPFDGARMIYGGFETIVEHGEPTSGAYVQGFVIPVPAAKKEAYRKMAEEAWEMFRGYGALRVVEAWQDEVPEGKQTDFFRSVKTQPGDSASLEDVTFTLETDKVSIVSGYANVVEAIVKDETPWVIRDPQNRLTQKVRWNVTPPSTTK